MNLSEIVYIKMKSSQKLGQKSNNFSGSITALLIGKPLSGSLVAPIPKPVSYPLTWAASSCLDQGSTNFFYKGLDG